ncbi:uncharacterized protein [Engystomops pustulosus]|uniref:uncharacterized protein n=1 Tax=Engystomops pustulosus TaxID=76066 RepID=UPI003AFAA2FE
MSALNLDTYSLSLITAKEDILSDRTSTDWAVFTYEKKWSLKLLDSGVGGLEELTTKFNKNLIQYGLCRVTDPNAGVTRVILIHWVGEDVDAFRREITAQHIPSIRKFFKEANVVLAAKKIEDITQEVVAQVLSRVPPPARAFQKPRIPGSHELVGTKYMKTNPAVEMKISKREAFWQRSEREEERRKEMERLRLQEERIALERERIQRERLEEEERERRIQEKERLVEEQRKEQARLEAERRRLEKERWVQQQKEYEDELKGRFKRSQSIEMAAEAAALVSGRSLHPRDFFRQHERSVSSSFSPPSTPSSPCKSSSGFFNRTTPRYQRSMTETILTPTSRSPTFFQGFHKRDSFRPISPSTPQQCSPAFIFSKSPLPGTSPKVDSLPPYIPPPITSTRVTTAQIKGSPLPYTQQTPPGSSSNNQAVRAEYVTVSSEEHNSKDTIEQASPQQQDLHSRESPIKSGDLFRAELVAVESSSTSLSEVQDLPNKAAKSTSSFTADKPTAIKATVSTSALTTEMAVTRPAPASEAKIPADPQNTETLLSMPPYAAGATQSSKAEVTTPTQSAQVSLSVAPQPHKTTNKSSKLNCTDGSIQLADSASSYEPRITPGSTSLVSLLAPTPYTPYRTQKVETTIMKSLPSTASISDHALLPSLETPSVATQGSPRLDVLPSFDVDFPRISVETGNPSPGVYNQSVSPVSVSDQPHIDSFPESQCCIPQAPPSTSVPYTSESQPSPSQTEVPLIDPAPASTSLPVYEATTQPRYSLVDVPDSLSMSLPLKNSSQSQLYDLQSNIPLPETSCVSPELFTQNSAETELNNNQSEVLSTSERTSDTQANNNIDEISLPILPLHTANLAGSLLNKTQTDPLMSGASASPFQISNEHQPNTDPPEVDLTEIIPVSPPFTNSCDGPQANNIPADIPLVETSCELSSISSELYSGHQQTNIPADIPLHQPQFNTIKDPYGPEINVQANIPLVKLSHEAASIAIKDGARPQLNMVQTDNGLEYGQSSLLTSESTTNLNRDQVKADISSVTPSTAPKLSAGLQLNTHADILLVESSLESSLITTKDSSGSQLTDISTDIPLMEASHDPPSITTKEPSGSQLTDISTDIPLMEASHEPPSITTKESSGNPLMDITADIPLIKPSDEPPFIITEESSGSQPADIPLIESSHEPPFITTGESSGPQLTDIMTDITLLKSSHDPPSITTKESSGSQLTDITADKTLLKPLHESSSITTEESSGSQLTDIPADITLLKSLHDPPSITTEESPGSQLTDTPANIPLIESSHEPPSITTEESPGSQLTDTPADMPLIESSHEPPSITTEESPGSQLTDTPADMPLIESSHEPPSITTQESSGSQLTDITADITLLKSSHEPPSITTEESPGSQLTDITADKTLLKPSHESSSITTEESSGPQLTDIMAHITLLKSSHDPPSITTKESSGSTLTDITVDNPLIESLHETPSITSGESPGPQLTDTPVDIILLKSSHEPPSITNKESSGFPLMDITADIPLIESLHEHPSITFGVFSRPQLTDIPADITLLMSSHEPPSITTEESSGPQLTDTPANIPLIEASNEQPSITNEQSSGPQLNVHSDITLTVSFSGSSSLCPESSAESLSNRVPPECFPEPPSLTGEDYVTSTLIDVQTDSVSSSFPAPSSSGSQSTKFQESLAEEPLILTENLSGPQLHNTEEYIPLPESPLVSSSLPTQSSAQPQINRPQDVLFPESSYISTFPESYEEPHVNNIKSELQVLESSPDLFSTKSLTEPQSESIQSIASVGSSSVSSSLQTFSYSEPHSNEILADIPFLASSPSPLTNENLTESQLNNDVKLEVSHPPSESSIVSEHDKVDNPVLESPIVTTVSIPGTQSIHTGLDAQSAEAMTTSTLTLIESSKESQVIDDPQEPLTAPFPIITSGSTEPQPSNMEVNITQELPRAEPQPSKEILLPESSSAEESSPITIDTCTECRPHDVLQNILSIGTSPYNNDHDTQPFSIPITCDNQPLLNILQTEVPSSVSTCPPDNTSSYDDCQIFPVVEEVLPGHGESSHKSPFRSLSPSSDTVYAEKVILVEDQHPGSPPVNGNVIALESSPEIHPGDGEVKPMVKILHDASQVPVCDALSSSNITVGEDEASQPPGISSCEQRLNNSSSETSLL